MSDVIDNDTQQVLTPAKPPAAPSPLETMAANAIVSVDNLLSQAMRNGASEALVMRLLDMKAQSDAERKKQAFDDAFARFKAKCMKVIRATTYSDGPLKGKKYATLADVVDTATEHLSEFGLSSSWVPVEVPAANLKDWVEIACILRHTEGHEQRVQFGGPIDTGPGRSAIQARKSSVSYLERITFLLVTGLAEADADDDGQGGPQAGPETALLAQLTAGVQMTTTDAEAMTFWRENNAKLGQWPYAFEKLKKAVAEHRAALKQKQAVST